LASDGDQSPKVDILKRDSDSPNCVAEARNS
jgi:hypothetical protein